jgi:hypothetical protein
VVLVVAVDIIQAVVDLVHPIKDMLVEMVIMDLYQPLVQVVAVVVLVLLVQIFLLQTLLAMVV